MRTILLFLLVLFAFSFKHSQAQSRDSSVLEELITYPIQAIEWHPSGDYLAVATRIADMQNDVRTGKLSIYTSQLDLAEEIALETPIQSVSWNPEGTELVIVANRQLEIFQWDSQTHTLTLNRVITPERYPLYALWSPTGADIAMMELFEYGDESPEISYYLSFWDSQTGQQHAITSTPILTRQYFQDSMDINGTFVGIGLVKFFAWSSDGTELYVIGLRLDTRYSGFFAINPQTGEFAHQFETQAYEAPRTLAVSPGSSNIYITEEFGVSEYVVETGEFIKVFHDIFDTILMDWSPDGRYIFVDGYVQTLDGVVGLTDNRDYESLFAVDWHPYRPIIAIGNLMGRLTIEDALYFERFQASPVANAGENQVVYVGGDLTANVQLDASASVDYDGTITGYEWRLGDTVLSIDATASIDLPLGSHEIQLTVTDDDDLTDSDTVQITITRGE